MIVPLTTQRELRAFFLFVESTMGRGKTRTSYNEFSTRERYGDTASGSQVKGCREKRSRLPANRLQRLDCHQQMGNDRTVLLQHSSEKTTV